MTRLPAPVLLRWPSWMRRDPRSGFAETSELAIRRPAPCIDAKTQLTLRAAEPENYTNGSARDRGVHIVTQPSDARTEIPLCPGGRPEWMEWPSPGYPKSGWALHWHEGGHLRDSAEVSRYGIEEGRGQLHTGRRQPPARTQRNLPGEKPMSAAIDVTNPEKPKRVAIVASNPGHSKQTGWPIGFWWAELVHPYWEFMEAGHQVEVFSPDGGKLEGDKW